MFCLNNSLEFEHRKLGTLLDFLGRELVWEKVSLFFVDTFALCLIVLKIITMKLLSGRYLSISSCVK